MNNNEYKWYADEYYLYTFNNLIVATITTSFEEDFEYNVKCSIWDRNKQKSFDTIFTSFKEAFDFAEKHLNGELKWE